MGFLTFVHRSVRLKDRPFSLQGRPYLEAIYGSQAQRMVIRAGRQVEKSTFLVNLILYEALRSPGAQILFVSPRQDQARLFSNVRLRGAIQGSPVLQKLLWPYQRTMPTMDIPFKNGTRVFVRSAYLSADAIRGISATMLLIDEFQDLAAGELPIIEETMSHTPDGRLILTGTPKLVDNHLESVFAESTAKDWLVPCTSCPQRVLLDEKVLGPTSLLCPFCQAPLNVLQGRWVARNPDAIWGDGFRVSQLMAPWLTPAEIFNKQTSYDLVRFRNEVLGLPTDLGDHLITQAEMEACCEDRPMVQSLSDVPADRRRLLVAGIDWGFGGAAATVLAIGHIDSHRVFRVLRLQRWRAHCQEAAMQVIAHLCNHFRIQTIAADGGGGGRMFNRLLLTALERGTQTPNFYSIFYSAANKQPTRDGALWLWTVDKSSTIGTLFTRIKKRQLLFPRLAVTAPFLDEFTCVYAEYDDAMRRVEYAKAQTHRDDALHATNYAELVGLRMQGVQ